MLLLAMGTGDLFESFVLLGMDGLLTALGGSRSKVVELGRSDLTLE
jgi:hypothetical protein